MNWIGHRHFEARHNFRLVFGELVLRHQALLTSAAEAAAEAEDECDDEPHTDTINEADVLRRGDPGMDMFEPPYETAEDESKTESCCKVKEANPIQFDCVVSLLAAGLSFQTNWTFD